VTRTDEIAPTLRFAQRLSARGTPLWIRFVFVPGLTGDPDDPAGRARFAATLNTVERVDVLPFHRLSANKYEQLGLASQLAHVEPPSPRQLLQAENVFR
jgi:pyruvate formate lyase activating enzyme